MKKIRVTMIVIFVAFLALVSGGSLLMKDREFSPNENRYLAEPPRLTIIKVIIAIITAAIIETITVAIIAPPVTLV